MAIIQCLKFVKPDNTILLLTFLKSYYYFLIIFITRYLMHSANFYQDFYNGILEIYQYIYEYQYIIYIYQYICKFYNTFLISSMYMYI